MIGALMLLLAQSAPPLSEEQLRLAYKGRANILLVQSLVTAAKERNAEEFAEYLAPGAQIVDDAGVAKPLNVDVLQDRAARCYDSRRVSFVLDEPDKITVGWKCPGQAPTRTAFLMRDSKVISAAPDRTIIKVRSLESGGSK